MRDGRWWRRFGLAAVAVVLSARPGATQELRDGWQLDVALSIGAFRIEGDRTVEPGDRVVPFAGGLGESRVAWSGRIAVKRGGWRGVLEAGRVNVDERHVHSEDRSTFPIRFRLDQVDLLVSRRLGKGGPTGFVETLAGLRYNRLGQQLHSGDGGEAEIRQGAKWVDPLIGFRYLFAPYHRVGFLTTVELGGFGLGSSFSWGVRMGCLVRLTPRFSSLIEYRILDLDYQRGEAGTPGSFVYNGTSHGLVSSLQLHF